MPPHLIARKAPKARSGTNYGAKRFGPPPPAGAVYSLFSALGGDRIVWQLDPGPLRILLYHGVCEDEVANEPWIPRSFVTRSAFASQLQYLKQRNACVLPLAEAITRFINDDLPARSIVITFDDGYANNLELAYPLLCEHALPATILVSTAYVESGELLPMDQLRLISSADPSAAALEDKICSEYRNGRHDTMEELVLKNWPETSDRLSPEQVTTLRPLSVEELTKFDPRLVEIGGHCHRHCILSHESTERREWEIRHCIECIRDWTGQPVKSFAYPNGQLGGFGAPDQRVLREIGVTAGFTSISGANRRGGDLLGLRRYPVGLYHKKHIFAAEIAGFRTLLRSFRRSPR